VTQGLKIDEGDPRAWRKLAATLGVVLVLFAPACQANIDTDDDVQTEDDGDVDLDDDTVQDDDADVDVDVEEDDDSGL
jgi:hypothetical protein